MQSETRLVSWDQIADLTGLLYGLSGTYHAYRYRTDKDINIANQINEKIYEQQLPHLDDEGNPADNSCEGITITLTKEEWEFLEKWFVNNVNLGQWRQEAIGRKAGA